jgi:phosphohistidine phosphatase
MLRLLLMRHAKAERSQPGEGDVSRRLTERGRADAATVGAYLQAHGLAPDAAAVSPAARTRETWDLVAQALANAPQATWDDRLYDATPGDILKVIQRTPATAGTLLVIGHNPGLHALVVGLIASGTRAARQRLAEGMPTSTLAAIDFTDQSWAELKPLSGRLERFVTARGQPED